MELQWWELFSYVVGIAGILVGSIFWTKWNHLVKLLKELGEAFAATAVALEDKEITKSEAIRLLKEWSDVYLALCALLPSSFLKKLNR